MSTPVSSERGISLPRGPKAEAEAPSSQGRVQLEHLNLLRIHDSEIEFNDRWNILVNADTESDL